MRIVLIMLIVSWLTGCSPISVPPLSTYRLDAALKARSSLGRQASKTKKTLLLTTVVADSGFDTNKMLYVNIPYKLKSFANNMWVAPPATMLQSLLANSLRQTHYFSAVVSSPYSGLSNVVVSARLLTLQQEFLRPVSQERLAIAVTVLNTQTNRVIGNRVFQRVVSAPGNDPYSGVLAANKAAQILSQQIAAYIVKVSA